MNILRLHTYSDFLIILIVTLYWISLIKNANGLYRKLFQHFIYKEVQSMVYSGIFPLDGSRFNDLKDALDKLKLNDASLSLQKDSNIKWIAI